MKYVEKNKSSDKLRNYLQLIGLVCMLFGIIILIKIFHCLFCLNRLQINRNVAPVVNILEYHR